MSELYFFKVSCGVGMEYTHVYDCTNMGDSAKDDLAWELAVQCAESFGDLYDLEDYYELQERGELGDRDFCDEDLDYFWEPYRPEKHDQLRCGGGSFMDDFED